jgi:hypothetical protein
MVQDHQRAAEKADLVRGFGAPGFEEEPGKTLVSLVENILPLTASPRR